MRRAGEWLAIALSAIASMGTDCCPCCPGPPCGTVEVALTVVDAKTGCALPCFFVDDANARPGFGPGPAPPPPRYCVADVDAGVCVPPSAIEFFAPPGSHVFLIAAAGYVPSTIALSAKSAPTLTVKLEPQ